MADPLTPGGITLIAQNNQHAKPVVQCIGKKVIQSNAAQQNQTRWRLAISDGQHWMSVMLATQLNELINHPQHPVDQGTVIRIQEFILNNIQGKQVVIVLQMDFVRQETEIQGNPQPLQGDKAASAPQPAPQGMQQGQQNMPYNQPPARAMPSPQQSTSGSNRYNPGYGASVKQEDAAGGYNNRPPLQQNNSYGPPRGPAGGAGGYGGQQNGAYGGPQQGGYDSAPGGGYGAGQNGYGGNAGGGYGRQNGGGYGGAGGGGGYGGGGQQGGGYGGGTGYGGGGPNGNAGRGGYGGYGGGGGYDAPAPKYGMQGSAPVARNEAPARIVPIKSLNAYQNRWTVKGRVTNKTELKTWSNARGEGRFFTFDLIDGSDGEIRCIAFNEVADKFMNTVSEQQIVTVSKASLKPKRNPQYNRTKHDHEIHLENQTVLEVCPEDNAIPAAQYTFVKLSHLLDMEVNCMVDLLAVVEHVDQATTITRKDGSDVSKRNVRLVDDSNSSIELTLWGRYATENNKAVGDRLEAELLNGRKPVIAAKQLRLGDFGGRSLSSVSSTNIIMEPQDIPEAHALRQWHAGGGAAAAKALGGQPSKGGDRRILINMIEDENLGSGPKPDWVQVVGAITQVNPGVLYYPACTRDVGGRMCQKKLMEDGDGSWQCARCGTVEQVEYRYITHVVIKDLSGMIDTTFFQDQGTALFGMSANELHAVIEEQGEPAKDDVLRSVRGNLGIVKLKVAMEEYQGESKRKSTAIRMDPINFRDECQFLLSSIQKLLHNEPVYPPKQAAQPAGAAGGGMSTPQQQQRMPLGGNAPYNGAAGYGNMQGGYQPMGAGAGYQQQGGFQGGYNGGGGYGGGYGGQQAGQGYGGGGAGGGFGGGGW